MVTLQMPSRSNITDIHAPSDRLANLGDRHASWEATRTTAAANGQPGDALYDTDEEDPEVQHLKEVKLVENAPKAKYVKRMTERRKLRNKEFGAWFKEKAENWKEESKRGPGTAVDDDKLSARALVHQSTRIISEPREYQLQLFEIAKQMNCLAVLDTGSGKTLIACLLIRHMVDQELEARLKGSRRRVSFFLVDSVTLVFQQASVLSSNIDAIVGRYYGAMCDSAKMWNIKSWVKILDEEQVIVMTADVLHNLLTHAFVKMDDINLLCFDEAHHAKKNHVYARIIRDFYLQEPEESRPKIFGMTASPVDARVDVVQAASELETLLHSRIITTSDLTLLQSSMKRPEEQVVLYAPLKQPFETELCQVLYEKYGKMEILRRIFIFAKEATSELGPWCADRVWSFALSEAEAHKMERKTEKILNQQVTKKAMENTEADIRCIREAREFVSSYKFSPPSNNLLSSKAFLLGKYLSKLFAASPDEKIIIFVRRRFTAKCLFDCLKDSVPNMRMGILVGSRSGDVGEEKFSLRMQMLSVHRFRRGKLNCLIATSVAEEGLDIPDCSIVFRFDLYSTMIQYIQSRGRARHSASKYLHMVEKGNKAHMQIMKDCMEAEATMRSFCQSLPEDRLLDKENQSVVSEYNTEPFYIEPETGATLTFSSAMQVVSHYAANLPMDGDDIAQALYIVRPAGEKFICELVLPSSSSLGCYEGPRALTKSGAKRAAAFGACMQLRKDDHLDANLLPKLRTKERPKYANARLAVDAKKMNTYTYRPKPRFWDVKDETAPKKLWVTIYSVVEPGVMYEGKPLQPICIATREKFPRLPEFPVYGTKGAQSTLRLCQLDTPLEVTDEVLKLLDNFTDRCFFDVFNKHFEFTYSTLRYWLAPVLVDCEFNKGSLAAGLLDWKAMSVALSRELMFSPGDDPNILENKFFIDRVDRSRRFIAGKYKPGIGPLDKVPDHISQAVQFENIRDYSYNAGKKRKWQQVKWKIPDHEPVFSSERLLHRINFLDPPAERHTESVYEAYIIPSNFSVSTIPAGAVRSITMLPSVSTRIDGYLQAWELSKILRMGDIKLDLALEAITKDSDNTDQSLENQVNKQRGMGKNYERLEFLGDCYLKLATSISLFCVSHSDDEHKLHVERMILVCNQNLFEQAKLLGVPDYVQTQGFSRRTWYPDMKLLHGKKTGESALKTNVHKLGDKSVADVCEAMIGAALLDKGLDGATKMVSAILQTPKHSQKGFSEYYQTYEKPIYQLAAPTASQQKLADDIEKQFGYKFQSPKLLTSAFTHPSNPYSWEKVPSYQRLEFLGDALLDLACVQHIFEAHPDADPQWLTEHKMAMVSNRFLGAVSVVLGFGKRLRKVGAQLDAAIHQYSVDIMEAKEKSNSLKFWSDLAIQVPPKVLPDILEAFIGALFVDSEFDYRVVETFFNAHIRPYFVDMSLYDDFAGQHPTTFLTKKLTDLGCENWGWECDQFRSEEEAYVIAAILVHGEVFSWGRGTSSKTARVQASEEALNKIAAMNEEEVRKMCWCNTANVVKEAVAAARDRARS